MLKSKINTRDYKYYYSLHKNYLTFFYYVSVRRYKNKYSYSRHWTIHETTKIILDSNKNINKWKLCDDSMECDWKERASQTRLNI